MPGPSSVARTTTRQLTCSVDVALFAPRGNELAILLLPPSAARSRGKWTLPSDGLRADEPFDGAATRIAKDALGSPPSFLDQSRTHGGARRTAGATQIAVAYFGLTHDTR